MSYKVEGKRLAGHPGAQCRVQISEDKREIKFISYTTTVLVARRRDLVNETGDSSFFGDRTDLYDTTGAVDYPDYWMIKCYGTYSKTTRIQMGWFLEEYFSENKKADLEHIAGDDNLLIARLTKRDL